MNLYIIDEGDPSVGIFQAKYTVECPFEEGDHPELEELDFFKDRIVSAFREHGGIGNMYGLYDFEIEQMEERLNESEEPGEPNYCTVVSRSGLCFLAKVGYSEEDEVWCPYENDQP